MAQSDITPGLLSKVAKFVRNPTKDWSELNQKEPDQESGYSKEALKEMIERKRQNDFVRKREFDHLRKLRQREPSVKFDQGGRPSFFQSSLTSNLDERAETLKKIDEIEAQMSHQWWKGKQEDGSVRPSSRLPLRPPPADSESIASIGGPDDASFVRTEASVLQPSSKWKDFPKDTVPSPLIETAVTVPAQLAPASPAPKQWPASPLQAPQAPQMPQAPGPRGSVGAGFSTNRLFAVELADVLTDPDLEEAAIRFANGDDAGAEESLLAALQGENPRPEAAEAWMAALFDLYRATGQQARFDSVALEFASRFGRSAPAWFSTPDLLQRKSAEPVKAGNTALAQTGLPAWSSPAQITLPALEQLQALMQRGHTDRLLLDWQALKAIAPEALPAMAQLFATLCSVPLQLVFRGYESLERALRFITPSGDRSSSPANWQLRLDALRVMGLQDEFELGALEYCVTFEMSPPSWQDVRCSCELEGASVGSVRRLVARESDAPSGWSDPALVLTAGMGLDGEAPAVVELSGEVLGDAEDALIRLEAGMEGATRLVVSCARLIRVDFSAAGGILNWVAVQKSKGCQVQFREVNRIVAAFFNVLGINEYARVVPRNA